MNKRIAFVRKKKQYTQDEFADRLSLTKNFISLIETGKRDPSDRTINDICEKFDVNETWLRTGKGEMSTIEAVAEEDVESDIAKLTVTLLTEPADSFKKRFVSLLAHMTDEEWVVLENMIGKLGKKE